MLVLIAKCLAVCSIAIEPQYDCAYPFEQGKAKVSTDCQTPKMGEHSQWTSQKWFFIDKKGKVLS